MTKLLQIRDVPDDVHRTLQARAAKASTSLSEYVRAEFELRSSADPRRVAGAA
jgi:plasmid stability protein